MIKMLVIGGGFIGQLLHVFFPRARVFDWRPKAPPMATRQLGPQYLWEPMPELPCRRFIVHTHVDGREATSDSIRAYKCKVGKEQDDSDWLTQFRPKMDGYECALPASRVEYGKRIVTVDLHNQVLTMADTTRESYDFLMSTIPLTALMSMCGWTREIHHFLHRPIYMHCDSLHPGIESDANRMDGNMYVNYISTDTPIYRETIRDGRMFTESLVPIQPSVKIHPGKIYATPYASAYVKQFAKYGVYCFGRFAVWNPEELAHETLNAIRRFKQRMDYE